MRFSGANAVPMAGEAGRARADVSVQSVMRERNGAHKKDVTMLQSSFSVLKDAAVIFETDRDEGKVDEVQEIAREWLQLLAKVDTNSKIINELFGGNQREGETLTQFMARRLEELESSVKEDAYKQHALWLSLRQELWNVHHEGEPLPEQLNGNNDEIVVVRRAALVCPLTTATVEEPVKNSECGHVYSKSAVTEYVQRKKKRGEALICPVVGCNKVLKDLEDDPETRRALQKAAQGKNKKRARPMLNIQSQE
jgi:hypothetical protein